MFMWLAQHGYNVVTNPYILEKIRKNHRVMFSQSSNINEVIRPVLNFLYFFFTKRFYKYKKAQNIKNVYKKHLSSNTKSLRQFSFLTNFV